ncbi:hypothetical protein QT711_13210 [Sporosarcina saromensis]|uniref:YjzC-like protein n=1 Tax=Sporosarcina saromensis TaxID=359365 RepID=A0ABU4GAY5_9BACL|nr:hypothetical protein [Sporosarcina saromensis]MDW0114149.1 hypothetical protein [Sporosarcina saromensis]
MTIKDGKYPNKKDLEPKVLQPGKGMVPTHELPLADPSDSNWTRDFRKNAQDETGKHEPSAYSENKPPASETVKPKARPQMSDTNEVSHSFNEKTHEQWNEHKKEK